MEPLLEGGDAMLITVFATWCRPCNREVPGLNQLSHELAGRGIRVVGVSVDDAPADAVAAWMRRRQVSYPIYYADRSVRRGRSLLGSTHAIPLTVLVSPTGVVLRRWQGQVSVGTLRAAIRPLLRRANAGAGEPDRKEPKR